MKRIILKAKMTVAVLSACFSHESQATLIRRSRYRKRSVMSFLLAVVALTATLVQAQTSAGAAFDKLKSLAGQWQGKNQDGQSVRVSYQIISGGTALIETLDSPDGGSMISIYHRDRDDLMMTHYCDAGNQPRMRSRLPAGEINSLTFNFVDVSNLARPSAGHMRKLLFTFQDLDHMTQIWTWRENGKNVLTTFRLERSK